MHDVIIVGAGTAGCVLAERLSASGRRRVLLIEAGGKPSSPFVKIPAGFAKLFKSKLDWAFESEPGASTGGRRVFTPRGKMLGGSSNMNAQIHQWCHPADFEGWVASGAKGWGWQDVAPVFLAQEHWLGSANGRQRGEQGAMLVSPNANHHPLSQAFVEAAQAAGLNGPQDYNGGDYQGAWICQVAQHRGQRYSAYDAYLKPAMQRSNLEVVTDAQVAKIIIEDGCAVGVTVRRGNTEQTYKAGGGVVLAAGAFGSPQILMLSGIGDAETLRGVGLPVVVNSPEVGANLQDHPIVPMVFHTNRKDTLKNAESLANLLRYLLFKRGMLASNAIEAFAFTRSGHTPFDAPDIELLFCPLEWRNQGLEPPSLHAFCIGAIAAAPLSRGRVSLKGPDPLLPPAIDLGLLTDPEGIDAKVMLAAMRLARKIAATKPLAADCTGELHPGEAIVSDDDLRAWVNTCIQTVYHPSGTCRMGSDQRAVVTPQLRVQGVEGLWVADASVMPSVPRGHPNAVVAMIANRAADWMEVIA
jgi:choline dehydrogenase